MYIEKLEKEIESLVDKAKAENNLGNFEESFIFLKGAWDILPEPKGNSII